MSRIPERLPSTDNELRTGHTMGCVGTSLSYSSGTIEDNLQFGSKDGLLPSQDDIKAALRPCDATPVIQDMPLGIKTMINSGGDMMSGGQKQRAAIARERRRGRQSSSLMK